MAQQCNHFEKSGLHFFGQMAAANAHEIKNALAVINENAGLLEDFIVLAEKGVPFNLSRLKRLAGAIKQQVARADHIAKSINRFAHSVDKGREVADIEQSLNLVTDMATRFANLRGVHLQLENTHTSITLPVRPFNLLHLLWLCLYASIKTCQPGHVLVITANKSKDAVEICYGPLPLLNNTFILNLRSSPEMMPLLCTLGGELSVDSSAAALKLTLKNSLKAP